MRSSGCAPAPCVGKGSSGAPSFVQPSCGDIEPRDAEGALVGTKSSGDANTPASALFQEAGKRAIVSSDTFFKWGALEHRDVFCEFLNQLPPRRRCVASALASFQFEVVLTTVLLSNFAVAVVETNGAAKSEASVPGWVDPMNLVLLALYSLEIGFRIYVYRQFYFRSWWNLLDIGVVALDLGLQVIGNVAGDMPNISVLRTFRLIRLARAFRVVVLFPELNQMLTGLASAMKTVFWGMIVILSFVVFFSLVAVQMIHPINKHLDHNGCGRCPKAYGSVWSSACTILTQTIAGDSWGTITLQVIEDSPWTIVFFLLVLFSINLVVVNLILAVVVEKATSALQEEHRSMIRQQAREKATQVKEAQSELLKLCMQMDKDRSGTLTMDELLGGFDTDTYFSNLLKSMSIYRDEVAILFSMFDKDGSGDVDYIEFVSELHKLKFNDSRNLMIWIMHDVRGLLAKTAPQEEEDAPWLRAAPATAAPPPSVPEEDREELTELAALIVRAQRTCEFQATVVNSLRTSCRRAWRAKR